MSGLDGEIGAHYDRGTEDGRLAAGDGLLEFARTRVLLRRCLPAAPARVLDIGGGRGRYAAWLASVGYEVTLIDPVPLHVSQAQARAAEHPFRALPGDARALDFADEAFDAAILLGPLYHLTDRQELVADPEFAAIVERDVHDGQPRSRPGWQTSRSSPSRVPGATCRT